VLGASPSASLEVTLPLIRPGVFAGGVFALHRVVRIPVSLFLVVPKGETLPVVLFNYMKFDLDGAIARPRWSRFCWRCPWCWCWKG